MIQIRHNKIQYNNEYGIRAFGMKETDIKDNLYRWNGKEKRQEWLSSEKKLQLDNYNGQMMKTIYSIILVLFASLSVWAEKYPHILVKDEDKSGVLDKIEKQAWAKLFSIRQRNGWLSSGKASGRTGLDFGPLFDEQDSRKTLYPFYIR